jgi:hypothetical protein
VLDGRGLVVVRAFSGVWVGRAARRVVLCDIVVDEGFSVELSHVVVVLLHNGTCHKACSEW